MKFLTSIVRTRLRYYHHLHRLIMSHFHLIHPHSSLQSPKKPTLSHTLNNSLLQLGMKTRLIQEQNKPCNRRLPLKKRPIFMTKNEVCDQEAHPSTFAPSKRTSRKVVTPSPALRGTAGRTASNFSLSVVTSDLLVLNLDHGAACHSSVLPKTMPHCAPTKVSIRPPLKREPNVSYFTSPIPSSSSEEYALKVKHTSAPCFTKVLDTQSAESYAEPVKVLMLS